MTVVVICKNAQDATRRLYWTGVRALDPSGGDVQVVEDWA